MRRGDVQRPIIATPAEDTVAKVKPAPSLKNIPKVSTKKADAKVDESDDEIPMVHESNPVALDAISTEEAAAFLRK